MNSLKRVILKSVYKCQPLLRIFTKLSLYYKRSGDIIFLIQRTIFYEAVELRFQHEKLQCRRHHQLEHGVLITVVLRIFLLEILHGFSQVDGLGYIALVVRPARVDKGHEEMDGVYIPYQLCIKPVSDSSHFYGLPSYSSHCFIITQSLE